MMDLCWFWCVLYDSGNVIFYYLFKVNSKMLRREISNIECLVIKKIGYK